MKLYTEEQVIKAIELAQQCEHECGGVYFDYTQTEIIEELTHIELPSDEEINKEALNYITYSGFTGFTTCAVWLRHKIQGGNK